MGDLDYQTCQRATVGARDAISYMEAVCQMNKDRVLNLGQSIFIFADLVSSVVFRVVLKFETYNQNFKISTSINLILFLQKAHMRICRANDHHHSHIPYFDWSNTYQYFLKFKLIVRKHF